MNKRYQIFVSSTYVDLAEERLEVIKALLELDCIPCGMEYFPAASEESWQYIASLIDQCDYYVVIVGGRYGSVTSDGVSFTEKEFRYAQSKGIPCIAFTHACPEDLPAKKTEQTSEGRDRLKEFVSLLKRNLCKEWTTPHELGAVVSRSLTQLMKRHPRTGWIPANQAADPKATEEILLLTKKVAELEEDLRRAQGRPIIDISDLDDGNDEIALPMNFTILRSTGKSWPRTDEIGKGIGDVRVTWNDLFRVIAPRISPFATDSSIRSGINTFLRERYVPGDGILKKDCWVGGVTMTEDTYNLIKVQFTALGLVVLGKEVIGEKASPTSIWRLTENGNSRMLRSLAVKRPVTATGE